MKKTICAAIAAAAAMAAGSANAAVTYILDGGDAGFQLTLASYVTSYQNFLAAALDSCTPLPGTACESVDISPDHSGVDALFLNMSNLTPGGLGGILSWGFTIGALSENGVHSDGHGNTLTVSSTGALPEPATWGLMIAGFGLTGAALRRKRLSA